MRNQFAYVGIALGIGLLVFGLFGKVSVAPAFIAGGLVMMANGGGMRVKK